MIWLNEVNGADKVCAEYHEKLLTEFPNDHLYAAVLGSAYGGEVEYIAKLWGERGDVYGFDVFEDLHPKHLAEDVNSFEATCMEYWYAERYGTEMLSLQYQEDELKSLGLTNAHLVKGEVNPDSCKDIPKLHYAFLDMDIPFSMDQGYKAVKDKIVPGGYLFIHDTQNILSVGEWYEKNVLTDKRWEVVDEWKGPLLVGLRRVSESNSSD